MDFLTVAAAAGAGYIAKYLHKMSKENEGEFNSDSTKAVVVHGWQETGCDDSYTDLKSFKGNVGWETNIGAESSSCQGLGDFGLYQDCNILSLTSLPPGLDEKRIFQLGSGNIVQDVLGESSKGPIPDSVAEEVVFTHRFPMGGRSIRSRRPYSDFAKPLNSLESCLTAQLHEQHLAMENIMTGPHSSPSLRTRPLLITDGKRVISRASSDFQADTRHAANRIGHKLHLGAPRLPKRSMETKRRPTVFQRRVKPNNGGQSTKMFNVPTVTSNVGLSNPQGLNGGMHLFLMGVTIGILSTAVANKREMDKLNELLKQSKNLVQDLQDEIEMKHSMTVKELASENVSIQESDGNNVPTTSMGKLVDIEENCSKEDDQTAKQSEILSQIEAELEAELERLELNLKGSTLERLADFVELDPDYEADVAKGEFIVDTMIKIRNEESDEDKQGSTSSGHTEYANRPVSPRELSLRLHEVIKARLESRVMELETALEDSQKRVRSLEHSVVKFKACSEKGTASPQSAYSPDDRNNFDQPLVINLGGDALDAYNEAYEEIFRMVKTEEDETPPETIIYSDTKVEPRTKCRNPTNMPGSQNMISVEERSSVVTSSIERINWEEQQLSERMESDDDDDEDSGDDDDDDVLGKLLIRQIVEKTRQGSPLVLNAQRMLYSVAAISTSSSSTISSTSTTAPVSSSSTSTATTSSRLRFIHRNIPPIQILSVHSFNRILHRLLTSKRHESKSSRSPRLPIVNNLRFENITELTESSFQSLIIGGPSQTSDETTVLNISRSH